MGKASEARFWNMDILNEIQSELPVWMGPLVLMGGVDSRLSPREVREALLKFAEHNWGEGHPEGDDNDKNLKEGESVFALYRASDFVNEPFYIKWTPENYLQRFKSSLVPNPEPHPAYTEVMTSSDY